MTALKAVEEMSAPAFSSSGYESGRKSRMKRLWACFFRYRAFTVVELNFVLFSVIVILFYRVCGLDVCGVVKF